MCDSFGAAAVAEKLILLKEMGITSALTSSNIPGAARIHSTIATVELGGKNDIRYDSSAA